MNVFKDSGAELREILERSELLNDLAPGHRERLVALAERRALGPREYLFRIGDAAECAYVVVEGKVDFCLPISFGGTMKDVVVESKAPGSAIGWSAFVSPHRFTLSARAAEPSVVAAFPRARLAKVLEGDAGFGTAFMGRIAEIICARLLRTQALWARELQRSVATGQVGSQSPLGPGGRESAFPQQAG